MADTGARGFSWPMNPDNAAVFKLSPGGTDIAYYLPGPHVPYDKDGRIPIVIEGAKQHVSRPPSVADNAAVGYPAGAAWQHKGKVYQADANGLWAEASNVGGTFTEIMGAANVASAWGTIAMKAGFTGPAVDISVTIGAVPTAFTIGILPSGELDNLAASAAIGRADAGTFATCVKVYDQSGAGNHWVKDAANPAPFLVWDPTEGRFGITTGGPYGGVPRTLKAPAGVFSNNVLQSGFGVLGNSYTVFCVGRGNTSAATASMAWLYTLGDAADATYPRRTSGGVTVTGRFRVSKGGEQIGTRAIPVDCQTHALLVVSDAATLTMSMNEESTAFAPSYGNDAQPYSGGCMFTYAPSAPDQYASHMVFGFGVAKVPASAAQQKQLRYTAYSRFDIRPQVLDQVFLIGDSRTNVAHPTSKPFDSYPMQVAARLPKTCRVYSYGLYGRTCAEILANVIPTAVALYSPSARNTAVFFGGTNDLSQSTAPEQVAATIQACTSQLMAAGYRTVLLNELPGSGAAAAARSSMRNLLARRGATGMNADVLVDLVLKIPALASPANTAVYADSLHPTLPASSAVADVVVPQIS